RDPDRRDRRALARGGGLGARRLRGGEPGGRRRRRRDAVRPHRASCSPNLGIGARDVCRDTLKGASPLPPKGDATATSVRRFRTDTCRAARRSYRGGMRVTPLELVLLAGAALSRTVLASGARTPGALNPAVTQATIGATICRRGWTATVRPPGSYTNALKVQQMTAYGETG